MGLEDGFSCWPCKSQTVSAAFGSGSQCAKCAATKKKTKKTQKLNKRVIDIFSSIRLAFIADDSMISMFQNTINTWEINRAFENLSIIFNYTSL